MKVSKLIHDLHEKLENLEKENVELKSNMELGVDWEYDNDGNHVAYSKDDLNRQITNLRIKQKELKAENEFLLKRNAEHEKRNKDRTYAILDKAELQKEYDEKMKRLDYLEKIFASNRYVFTDIPNTPENLKMVKMMKKYVNKRRYNLRWRGQYLVDGENWKQYQYGQPLSKSKCIRVYIDNKAYSVDTVEGFNANEVDTIIDALNCWEDKLSVDFYKSDTVTQLLNYFESMRLHLENSASTPIKDLVNIVIPKGDKQCHTE